MFLDRNNNFYGKIGGKSIGNFLKFDYDLKSCQERIDFVNEVLGMYEVDGVEFYDEYFDEVYDQDRKFGKIDIVIGKDKSQYTESNIASALEMIANYILAVDEKEKSINYKIYTSEELFNKACKEYKLINSVARANGGTELMNNTDENIVESFPLYQLPKNFKKVKDLKIDKEDLEKYPPLKDYQDFYEYLKEESNRLWATKGLSREELVRRGKIKKILPEIKKDMLEVKKQLQMPIIWKAPLKDSGKADYDMLDMFDKNVVKELLKVKKQVDLQDDLSCILVDLENLIEKVDFDERQELILDMWRNGNPLELISKELNVTSDAIGKAINTIVGKIVKQYEEEYENWYYLNIRKGTYKQCNRCGKIKLTNKFNKNGKKGLKPMCKICENDRKKK